MSRLKAISNVLLLGLVSLSPFLSGKNSPMVLGLLHWHELLFLTDSSLMAGPCCRSALIHVYVCTEQLICHEPNLTGVTFAESFGWASLKQINLLFQLSQSLAEEQRMQGQEETDEIRADQDCFSSHQCCLMPT